MTILDQFYKKLIDLGYKSKTNYVRDMPEGNYWNLEKGSSMICVDERENNKGCFIIVFTKDNVPYFYVCNSEYYDNDIRFGSLDEALCYYEMVQ